MGEEQVRSIDDRILQQIRGVNVPLAGQRRIGAGDKKEIKRVGWRVTD